MPNPLNTRAAARAPRVQHLRRNRLGVWCFRLTIDGQTGQRSLGTKDRALATMLASKLNWEWAMTKRGADPTVADIIKAFKKEGREFDAEFPDGTKLTGIHTDDDLRRAKELMLARIEAIGPIEPHLAPPRPEYRPPAGPKRARNAFSKATKAYLAEKIHDNATKTRADKAATYAAFAEQFADPDMAAIDKPMAVAKIVVVDRPRKLSPTTHYRRHRRCRCWVNPPQHAVITGARVGFAERLHSSRKRRNCSVGTRLTPHRPAEHSRRRARKPTTSSTPSEPAS